MRRLILFASMACCLLAGNAIAANMTDYCQTPPFINTAAAPNVLLMVDTSGSMGYKAYSYNSTAYVPTKLYEGYFDPSKDYVQSTVDNVYYEEGVVSCPSTCTGDWSCYAANMGGCIKGGHGCKGSKWACCSEWTVPDCGINGNYLNYLNMSRMDLLRWAMTGGKPDSCTSSLSPQACDPSLYPLNTLTCDATGCTITTTSGVKVKARWDRITGNDGGVLYQLQALALQPRIGGMFFADDRVKNTVLLGDFTGSNNVDALNPYKNTITAVNGITPADATPMGPALWAAYAYLAQQSAVFGGPAPQTGAGNEWKNPMYQCPDVNNNGVCDPGELVSVPCAKNFMILLTDGQWNMGGQSGSVSSTCSIDTAYEKPSADPVVPAYWLHKKGFTNVPAGNIASNVESIYTVGLWLGGTGEQALKNVAMYGSFDTTKTWPGNKTDYPKVTCNVDDCNSDGKGSPCTALPPSSSDWDKDGDGIPDTFFKATDALEIKNRIMTIILDILKKASSGTAVSVLSSSEGSGANLMQALFYPDRSFDGGTEVSWTSDLMNYWYYMDPYFTYSQIREDTVREGATAATPYTLLDLKQDYITNFAYDTTVNKTLAHRWKDTNGTGYGDTDLGTVPIEETVPIWRAGFNLWWTDPTARKIYTSVDVLASTSSTPPTPPTLMSFDTTNSATLDDYLGQTVSADANTTINYVRGYDCVDAAGAACECGTANCSKAGRSRTVIAGVCSARKSPCNSDADCPLIPPSTTIRETCTQETHVWKLGDIISSTPRIMGPGYLNNYNVQSPFGYNDQTYSNFIKSNDYMDRQLAFVGANDGMLHAFKLGKLLQKWPGKNWYEAAKQEGGTGTGGIGSESYAFIPKNVLPYLQYLHDEDYCHIYMVDGPTVITDVSINKPSTCTLTDYWNCPKLTTIKKVCSTSTTLACNIDTDCPTSETCVDSGVVDFAKTSWHTTLVGSIGIGGATCETPTTKWCEKNFTACTTDSDCNPINNNGTCVPAIDPDRIGTPISVGGKSVGWSSYFALDVTDQATPQLLWEFSNADLGVTNVGSAIVKVGGSEKRCAISNYVCTTDTACGDIATNGKCVNTNGRWFAILASGSTGPIKNLEFKGTSDKNLKLFVLDLKTGALLRTIDTGVTNAFAGSISTSALDLQKDRPSEIGNYQDNAVYIGYVKDTINGGVLRLVINDDINPANWTVSKVIDNIGPVTTSVVNLLDRSSGKLWLYFAEGRYFYKQDDLATQRKLFGIQEPCFDAANNSMFPTCTSTPTTIAPVALADLKDQTTLTKVCSSSGGTCSITADCPSGQTCDTLPLTAAQKGWFINMGAAVAPMSAERVISNPTPDTLGAIYFLSFAPTADVCSFGGTTYLWALDYKTGGQVTFAMQGKALVQVSTGEIKELNMSDALTQESGRKSPGFKGIPPTGQGLMVIKNPEPIKKFMHVQEQ
ncbi:MAG: hypothetical protein NTY00_11610 [Deltaproteobacteria bacterium]|nr:hypothetical protein [Deltaproteobacteria bacterium]